MNKGGKLSDLQDFVCSMDKLKGGLEIHPMAEAVNFDGLVESCFKKMRPSSADCMFLSDGKTVYLEFKTWPYSPESGSDETDPFDFGSDPCGRLQTEYRRMKHDQKIKEQEWSVCKKLTDTAMIHRCFMSQLNPLPAESEFWLVDDRPSEVNVSIMANRSGLDHIPNYLRRYLHRYEGE